MICSRRLAMPRSNRCRCLEALASRVLFSLGYFRVRVRCFGAQGLPPADIGAATGWAGGRRRGGGGSGGVRGGVAGHFASVAPPADKLEGTCAWWSWL